MSQLGSWLVNLLGTGYGGYYGACIDRRQEVRYMGNFADVTRYDQALSDAGEWMWEANLAYAAHEPRHYNYEVERDAYLAGQDNATVLRPLDKEVFGGQREVEITLPDAATMATFDTLEFDLTMDCPDPAGGEFGNCGAWDYLSYIHLKEVNEAEEVTWREVARFITTYHREGRYLVDATPMLVYLAEGGTRTLRVDVSGQSYMTTLDVRLRDAGKEVRPVAAHYLFSGGGFNSAYSDKYEPMDIQIPETALKVELWAIITGHGMATYNCAEFCDHRHTFTVNGEYFQKGHPEVNSTQGCMGQIENGMVPNQGGTWWFGRGGWCPGQQVDPWTADVTEVVVPGETTTISYQGTLGSLTPPDAAGNIRMVSYLIVYE
ncbi:MAG: peptide-N-glycosidase F-related protein [Myxococcota bacterium]|nr:peptide-N-glycosidase F-related protein [Myxococcota bacterium]